MATVDLNDINGSGNAAAQSSAPPYQPILGQAGTDSIKQQEVNNAANPQLTPGETQTYTPIQNSPDQELNPQNYNTPIQGQTPVQSATASTIAQTPVTDASQYNASLTTGAQGTVDPNSLVQNQMRGLLTDQLDQNGIPIWAQPAATAANQRMNSLGLGASTMAKTAEVSAIISAALPMAQQNAATYEKLNLANLSNQQQAMLSNQAAENASKQFNAQSEQQNAQFFATLATNISTQNAQMQTAVSQFNAGQTNAAEQFNENLQNQQQQFNIGNQLLIDQSNVQWRRTINTANTAGINSVNQANAQNLFNMSQTAQNNLWQEAQDEASWALTSGENAQNRALSLVTSALNRQTSIDLLNKQESSQIYSQLGALGANILGGAITGLIGSGSSGSSSGGSDYGFQAGSGTDTGNNYGGGWTDYGG